MTGTTAQWLGAVAGLLTAIAAIGAVIPALVKVLRSIREVKHIVNQGRTDMLNYQGALVRALRSGGIDVPIDQSSGQEPTQ
jgi:hypothetical protein